MYETIDKYKYDDIKDLPHRRPQAHPHMPIRERAAQFASFKALRGYDYGVGGDEEKPEKKEEKREREWGRDDGESIYASIDLKSFYASVECAERGLDPMRTNLVVADESRTEKTICLAVSPSLKALGIPGRARLFEVTQRVREINAERLMNAPGHHFRGSSDDERELRGNPSLELSYIVAKPRMAYYMEYSKKIYGIYLRHVAPEDIHVYSVDEVFIDITHYLRVAGVSAREFVRGMICDVFDETGITATAGIGSNLYLAKVAMDIVAKHMEADEDGVRIAKLDEMSYRRELWGHRPLTDFWRVGGGYEKKLERHGLYTMGDIARASLGKDSDYHNEALLFRLFGVSAELLIDHAWGWEPCAIEDIREYEPKTNSIGSGQVLKKPYSYEKARMIAREMTELLTLDLVGRGLLCDQVVLTVGYDKENLLRPDLCEQYNGETTTDRYGRILPKHAHGSESLGRHTSSANLITEVAMGLFDRITDKRLLVRRINITLAHVIKRSGEGEPCGHFRQLSLFDEGEEDERKREEAALAREHRLQQAVLDIKKKYGKNAILKGTNLKEDSTAIERNRQIGGHKA